MTVLLPTLTAAFAAFCVWLTVQIINRRERWAKRTLADVAGVLVLYLVSIGPAYWMCTDARGRVRKDLSGDVFLKIYAPLIAEYHNSTPLIGDSIGWYLAVWGMP